MVTTTPKIKININGPNTLIAFSSEKIIVIQNKDNNKNKEMNL